MILLDVRDYIKERKSVPLSDLAHHFDIPESAIQPMVEHWIRKGYVIVQKPIEIIANAGCSSGRCSGCTVAGCDSQSVIYRWKVVAKNGTS